MNHSFFPTPFADVNLALDYFRAHLQTVLDADFLGMYLVGSLALGDFNPHTSDIDFVVVAATPIAPDRFTALRRIHAQFAASNSVWAENIEAIYVPTSALGHNAANALPYPQIEKGMPLLLAPLETGWVFQCLTIRNQSVTIAGPDPRTLVKAIDTQELHAAAEMLAGGWMEQAAHDPTWLPWLRQPAAQAFVVQTLCRLLYCLGTGAVASKPQAAEWARKKYGEVWGTFIAASLIKHQRSETITREQEQATLAFLAFTFEHIQRSAATIRQRNHDAG